MATFPPRPEGRGFQVDIKGVLADEYKKVVIVSHSQGGIIAAELVNRLVKDNDYEYLSEKLEVYTFASATNYMLKNEKKSIEKGYLVPHIEHFANTKDFISKIGVLHYKEDVAGHIYTNESSGHLLNIHYLVQFLNGEFGVDNKLFSYIPKETDIKEEIVDLKNIKNLDSNR